MVNNALQQGFQRLPISQPSYDFPIIQYADDTILIMEADVSQLIYFEEILQQFANSTGLTQSWSPSMCIQKE
jgi:hypothetical protein